MSAPTIVATVQPKLRRSTAAAVASALSAMARGRPRMRRMVGALLFCAFIIGCSESVVGSSCEQDGVGLVAAAHWIEGRAAHDTSPATPSDAESHCHCSPLYGTTIAVRDRTEPVVAVGVGAPVGRADRVPVGPEREPPLRPPSTLLS